MAQRRGPGRRISPGPQIPSGGEVPVPKELFENWITNEVLDSETSYYFDELPEKLRKNVINSLYEGLFTLRGNPNVDTTAIYLGEESAFKGVTANLDLREVVKNPSRAFIEAAQNAVMQIYSQQDIEREVERRALLEAMTRGTLKDEFKEGATLMPASYDTKIVEPEMPGGIKRGIKGVRGKKAFKNMYDSVNDWLDKSQSLANRGDAKEAVSDKLYEILQREFADAWDDDVNVTAQKISDHLSSIDDPEIKSLFSGFLSNSQYTSKFSKPIISTSSGTVTMGDLMGDITRHNNAFAHAQPLEVLLKGVSGLTVLNASPVWDNLKDSLLANRAELNLSEDTIEKVFDVLGTRDANISSAINRISTLLIKPGAFDPRLKNTDLNPKELDTLRRIFQDVKSTAGGLVGARRDAMAKDLENRKEAIAEKISSFAPVEDSVKAFIKREVLAAFNIESYVELRTNVEAAEEWFDYVGKGDLFGPYFFFGKYNDHLPGWMQKINKRMLETNIPGTPYTAGDIRGNLDRLRDEAAKKVGIAGGPIDHPGWLGLGAFSNEAVMQPQHFAPDTNLENQVSMRFRGDDPAASYKFVLNHPEYSDTMYDTHTHLKGIEKTFTDNLTQWESGSFVIYAKDFRNFGDAYEAISEMTKNAAMFHPEDSTAFTFQMEDWFKEIMQARENFSQGTNGAFAGVDPEDFTRYKKALLQTIEDLETHYGDRIMPSSFLSTIIDLAKNKGFINEVRDTSGKVSRFAFNKHLPLLNKVSQKLTNVQTKLFNAAKFKILRKYLMKTEWGRNLWHQWNPGYGPVARGIDWAKAMANWKWVQGLKRFINIPAVSNVLKFMLPPALYGASGGTVYLIVVATKTIKGLISSGFKLLKADIKGAWYEVVNIPKSLLWDPVVFFGKFLGRILIYSVVALTALTMFFVFFIAGDGVLSQDREVAVGGNFSSNYPVMFYPNGEVCFYGNPNTSYTITGQVKHPFAPNISSCQFEKRVINGVPDIHMGMDYPMPSGTPVTSPVQGCDTRVSKTINSNSKIGFGTYVVLEKTVGGNTYYLYFGHLLYNSIIVTEGQTVCEDQQLGSVGSTGWSTGPHLHFEIRESTTEGDVVSMCEVLQCPARCPSYESLNEVCL